MWKFPQLVDTPRDVFFECFKMSESCSTFEFSRRRVQNKEVKVVTILLLQILSNCQKETFKAAQLSQPLGQRVHRIEDWIWGGSGKGKVTVVINIMKGILRGWVNCWGQGEVGAQKVTTWPLESVSGKVWWSQSDSWTEHHQGLKKLSIMTSADATSKAQLNLENRSRPAWSESSTGGETNQAWSGSQGSGESPRQSYSSPSKIENPEKTRSNWSRLVKSPDADVEQDHAVSQPHE